jgi:hypothetical protein
MRNDPVLGVILLEADHSVETVGWTDPFSWEPLAGLSVSFFGHPRHWPLPAVFAVARGATGTTSALGTQEAVQGVADAIGRLDGHCDLIVGGCGYFGDAWPLLDQPPAAFTLLSALDLVDATLASTSRDIVVMSASTAAARRVTGRHPQSSRIRLIGLDGVGEWANFARPDWATAASSASTPMRPSSTSSAFSSERSSPGEELGPHQATSARHPLLPLRAPQELLRRPA